MVLLTKYWLQFFVDIIMVFCFNKKHREVIRMAKPLKRIMELNQIGVVELAYKAQIHPNTIYSILQGGSPNIKTLRAIATVLKCKIEDLF